MMDVRVRLALDAFVLDVDLRVTRRVTAVFGPSGAGKSSLLECVVGLRRAQGRVRSEALTWMDTERGVFVAPEARRIGYVPQEGLLFPHLDVLGNLHAGAQRRGRRPGHGDRAVQRACDILEIGGLLNRSVASLSGGERQRVALARAVASDPTLLVLDEPLASLDARLRRRVLPFLCRLRDELDLPMLYVSHDAFEVQALCDDVIALRDGRVVLQGPPVDVLSDPALRGGLYDADFENVLTGTVVASGGEGGAVDIGAGVVLRTPEVAEAVGTRILVGVPAQQVLLAIVAPEGISAQNVLQGRVVTVRDRDGQRLAAIALGREGPELVAEVTPRSCAELTLTPGREVFVIIKQTGCRVYEPASV